MATLNPPDVGPADHVSVRLGYDTMRQIRALSAERQASISDVVREAVCAFVGTSPPPPRKTRTLNRIERTEKLINGGMAVYRACEETGLDTRTWYRHTSGVSNDRLCDDVLAVVTAIRQQVA